VAARYAKRVLTMPLNPFNSVYKNIRDASFQEIAHHEYECIYALSGFHRVVALTKTTIFNWERMLLF